MFVQDEYSFTTNKSLETATFLKCKSLKPTVIGVSLKTIYVRNISFPVITALKMKIKTTLK